jgi:hypothetical protein
MATLLNHLLPRGINDSLVDGVGADDGAVHFLPAHGRHAGEADLERLAMIVEDCLQQRRRNRCYGIAFLSFS